MSPALDRGTTIGRLRIRAAARDPLAVQMRSEAVLRAADLQPESLPAQAILCIRALGDPLPGALDLEGRRGRPPAPWQRAARASLEAAARRASRPAREAVPASADAVLFADRAELLACAARDSVRGTLALSWWWQHLLEVREGTAGVARQFMRDARYVPAAVELLARNRVEIAAFARAISPHDAVRIIEAMLREADLPALAQQIVRALTVGDTTPTEAVRGTSPEPPPWLGVADEADEESLVIEQRLLLAVPLVLRRAPAMARSQQYATALLRWITTTMAKTAIESHEPPLPEASAAKPSIQPISLHYSVDRERSTERHASSRHSSDQPMRIPPNSAPEELRAELPVQATSEPTIVSTGSPQKLAGEQPRSDVITNTRERTRSEPPPALPSRPPSALEAQREALSTDTIETTTRPAEVAPEHDITSELAGAFFLINVGVALGFYSDFTAPAQRGIELDIFDFIDLLGSELAGEGFDDDPIHPFLAELAQRDPAAPQWTPPDVLTTYSGDDPPLARWIRAIADYLRLRLGDELARALVTQPGRITTTPAHLDVWFRLIAHPIEIRIAGLDRNPGWIPAAGRHVTFHFD
ncbi:MAG TPA: hypothetical protein VNN08_04210 [Thermoanaerobaculia bacterium]|nr:hypothetical protein [Thermoanaerobaculia bacterium]